MQLTLMEKMQLALGLEEMARVDYVSDDGETKVIWFSADGNWKVVGAKTGAVLGIYKNKEKAIWHAAHRTPASGRRPTSHTGYTPTTSTMRTRGVGFRKTGPQNIAHNRQRGMLGQLLAAPVGYVKEGVNWIENMIEDVLKE